MKKELGYSQQDLMEALRKELLAGQSNAIQLLFTVRTPPKDKTRLTKSLRGAENLWKADDTTTYHAAGHAFHGVASWGGWGTIDTMNKRYRFRILHLDVIPHQRLVYAIPAGIGLPPKALPGIQLGSDELQMVFKMADELADARANMEVHGGLTHPFREEILTRSGVWKQQPLDAAALLQLLENHPMLIPVTIAALDVALHGIKHMRKAPPGIYNFVLSKKDRNTAGILSAFQALTFTTCEESGYPGPALVDGNAEALPTWRACCGRLTIITSAPGVPGKLMDEAQEFVRLKKCQGLAATSFPAPPIILSTTPACHPLVWDVSLEKMSPLSEAEQDTLRAAMAQLVSKQTASDVYNTWKSVMSSMVAYRLDSFAAWRNSLEAIIRKVWFGCGYEERMTAVFHAEEQHQVELARQRESAIEAALSRVMDTEGYKDRTVSRPASVEELTEKLRGNIVAAHVRIHAGPDKDKECLAFLPETLKRFIAESGCGPELYEAFLNRCMQQGILKDQLKDVKFGKKNKKVVALWVL